MNTIENFKPYEGAEPYIFISYAHADSDEVLPVVEDLHRRGYNIWYDEGIEVGSEWQECIASHLVEAHLVIAFISNAYIKSDNCRREMHYALTKRKKTINIFLEETELSPGMEMQIGNIFALMKYTYPSEEYFYEKLYEAPLLSSENFRGAVREYEPVPKPKKKAKPKKAPKSDKKRKLIGWTAAVAIAGLIIAGLTVGYFSGFLERVFTPTAEVSELDPNTVAEFENEIFEQAAREYTGISTGDIRVGDLQGLTALYVCGDKYWFDEPAAVGESEGVITVTDRQGNEHTAAQGTVRTLSDLAYFPDLQTLWLRYQPLSSLSDMPACGVVYLNVRNNRLASLQGVGNLPLLRSLNAGGNRITELGDLNKCQQLTKAVLAGGTVTDFGAFKPLSGIREISVSNCTLSDVSQVLDHSSLRVCAFDNCDLRGSFFKSFDRERAITELSLVNCRLDSLAGISDFTGLTELRLTGSRGISDWSELESLTGLKRVYADSELATELRGLSASAGFELIIE